jgi:hypothetical protein
VRRSSNPQSHKNDKMTAFAMKLGSRSVLVLVTSLLLIARVVKCGEFSSSSLPSKAGKLTTGIVQGTIGGTAKVGYYLVQPRHVEPAEVHGLWRLQLDDGNIINLEVTRDHAIIVDDGRTFRMPYTFHKARWPIRARIEFQTKQYAYQAILHRKVAARNVLKMKGKITTRPGRWGGRKEVLHTFVGKRRLKLEVEEDDAVEDDEEDSEGNMDDGADDNQEYDAQSGDEEREGKQDDSDNAEEARVDSECEYDEEESDDR